MGFDKESKSENIFFGGGGGGGGGVGGGGAAGESIGQQAEL